MDHLAHSAHSAHLQHTMPGDHSLHDMNMDSAHASHLNGDHGCHGMAMTFHAGINEVILFDQWKTTTLGGLLGSMFGIMLMTALYEGLKYYREYLFWKAYNSLQYRSMRTPAEKRVTSAAEESRIVHVVGGVIHKQPPTMWSWMHCYQTFLHIVQMILSYFLMLIFMTYNVWLCLAVIVGAAIGYFLFGWKKSVVVDVTEHCH